VSLRRWVAVHRPSVRGRARADLGPLVLAAVVVAVLTLLAGAVQPLIRATADAAVQDAIRHSEVDVRAHTQLERDDVIGGRSRHPRLAEDVEDLREHAQYELTSELRAVLRPPVGMVTTPTLNVTDGSLLRTFRMMYLSGPPTVTWVAGGAPKGTVEGAKLVPYNGPPWPVQVGLSEPVATALGLHPGDTIPLEDSRRNSKDVTVSGVFRPVDPEDPAWKLVPEMLRPIGGLGAMASTRLAGLLSPDSLPDARLAFGQEELERVVSFTPEPGKFRWDSTRRLAAVVVTLKATSGSADSIEGVLKWETWLDIELRNVATRVDAATAQASVLLIGVLLAGVLVLLLAADVLVRRRTPALVAARRRGAGLPDLAAELLLESVVLTLFAAAVGAAAAFGLAGGVAWEWALPAVLAAVVAGPAFGTLAAARATRDRRVPANRSARKRIRDTGRLRRAVLEAAVVLGAVGALVTLRQRGVLPEGGDPTLPASAPAWGVLAGAVVLVRLLPVGTGLVLRRALRSRRPLAVFGAARAAATAGRVLPVLVMVTAVGLASFAFTLDVTTRRGLAEGARLTVGADARLDVSPAAVATTPELARAIAAEPGVRQVIVAQVTDGARIGTEGSVAAPRLVIMDRPDLRELRDGVVPALVRGDVGRRLDVIREGFPVVPLINVGTAPAIGDAADVVIVDTQAAAAAGLVAVPNTIWVNGPGAAKAVTAHAGGATALVYADLLRQRRESPLTDGLLRLAWTAAAVLLAFGLLGLVLGAASGAPERWITISRLRTLGLRPREGRWVATGELLPPVVLAAVGGPLLGVLLARLAFGPLALRQVTWQAADPAPVLPWWALLLVAVGFVAVVAVTVPAEAALRRGRRLGEILRVGE
jgi:putative ABC transport system permease protein